MINEKQTMYLAVLAIIVAVIGIGMSYYKTEGPIGLTGPEGAIGPAGPAGVVGPAGPQGASVTLVAEPESCSVCHPEAGADHQAAYDELYQDGAIAITNLDYKFTSPSTHTVTFKITKNGVPFDGKEADSLNLYWVPWTGEAFQFEPAAERLSIKGTLTYDGAGGMTSKLVGSGSAYSSNLDNLDGLVVLYGRDETIKRIPARLDTNKYPFAALLETGDGVDYVSAANNDGCEKCHTTPYLKHAYIYGQVNQDPTTDFLTCKACHLDNGEGGHYEWQLLVNDPETAVPWLHDEDTSIFTSEELDELAYTTSVMNDVHMSHAMEFPYPQSMANCVTCHEGKLDQILTAENFNGKTCKSCHPVTGSEEVGTVEIALATILPPAIHGAMDIETTDCAACHGAGSALAEFSDIHSGYDSMIYAAPGVKYSDAVIVTVDDASLASSKLTIKFSAASSIAGIDVSDIVPTVLVGMYGWDTKDFIVGPHERLTDDNNDGEISSSGDSRALEYGVGEEHPRYTTTSATGGSWEVVADLSQWASLIADGTVTRVEIAVIPELADGDEEVVALDAPSRTFDIVANDFDDDFYDEIVKLEGCENCHDALATNYHSPDRGGNIVVCRLCHITKSGGSHLEMQSRSIDSYVHAIHSFQAFDIGDIDFTNPVEALEYEHHIGFPYPTHAIDCESCHVEGMYEVPDQTKSMPGLLSGTDEVEDRAINDVPAYITGPASRACGGCHRAVLIKEDDVNGLQSFFQHTKMGGYLIESDDNLLDVIDQVMAYFE